MILARIAGVLVMLPIVLADLLDAAALELGSLASTPGHGAIPRPTRSAPHHPTPWQVPRGVPAT